MMLRRHLLLSAAAPRARRPNIVWIIGDDLGAELGCYGDTAVQTPAIDRLAGRGIRFTNCHSTSPVCSSSRSAFQTGVYQTSTGTHHHRSHRRDRYQLPAPARLICDLLRERGYFTCNVREPAPGLRATVKTDFNFAASRPFDGDHWNQRPKDRPFFAQVCLQAPHKGPAFQEARKASRLVDPARVVLPPYFPDHPVVRDEVANYYDAVQLVDSQVGAILGALEAQQLFRETVVFLFGDNGRCLLRSKQWLYETGTRVPLIVSGPGIGKSVRPQLCTLLDMTAETLRVAGLPVPAWFHGQPLLDSRAAERRFIVTARDRCGIAVDRIRSVRTERFRYIRNFMPGKPRSQPNNYIEFQYPTLQVLRELHHAGRLNPTQAEFLAPGKPEVELYDRAADPHEVRNLAGLPQYAATVRLHERHLERWMKGTGDRGAVPEDPGELAEAEAEDKAAREQRARKP
jgi:arylsulfatase A-like enzyme